MDANRLTLRIHSRAIPVIGQADVVVIGGGTAGIGAAVGAARQGASTVLVERYGFLGGTATAGLMTCMNGFRNELPPLRRQVIGGLAQEMVDRLRSRGACEDFGQGTPYCVVFDAEAYKHEAQRLCLEAGVNLQLHSLFLEALVSSGTIETVILGTNSGLGALRGKVFVDASGDADLSVRAGAPYVTAGQGDEPPPMPLGLMVRLANVDIPRMLDYVEEKSDEFDPLYWMCSVAECRSRWESGQQFGLSGFRRCFQEKAGIDRGIGVLVLRDQVLIWGGNGGSRCGVDALELTESENAARERTYRQWLDIRRCLPGFANCHIVQTGTQIGVRETRRVVGEYQLTEDDVLQGKKFPDAVAVSMNSILPMGDGISRIYLDHDGYDIPYRSLIPKSVGNLLTAGRCQSASRRAFGSIRGIAICMVLGQAAGVAAALAATQGGYDPRRIDVKQLQQILIDEGNILDVDV